MASSRIWALVCGAAIVAVLAGGYFLGAQPLLAAAAATTVSTDNAATQNQTLQLKLQQLSKLAAKQDALHATDKKLRKAVPSILKPNTMVRRINELAALNGVTLKSATLGPAASYQPAPSLGAATPSVPATGAGEGQTPTETPAPTEPAAPSTAPLAKSSPLVTGANLSTVPLTVVVTGSEDALLAFSTDMQDDERVYLINSVSTTLGEDGIVEATFAGYIYTLKR